MKESDQVAALEPKYLNLKDASRYCGLSVRTLETAVASGEVKSFLRGKRLLLRTSLDEWVEQTTPAATADTP